MAEYINRGAGPQGPAGESFCDAYPDSIVCVTSGIVFGDVYVGAGANSKHERGIGVPASPASDGIVALRIPFPTVLPPGKTPYLRLIALAQATSGNARVTPSWASVAMNESPSAATLNSEGVQTITWGASDSDKYKETLIQLDADTVVAQEICIMRLTFETASWTLAAQSLWRPSLTWR